MTFIHEDENAYVGWFWQNSMQRLAVGDEAEVVIDGIPGKIFQGQVTAVIPAIAAGNVQANAGLLDQTSAVRRAACRCSSPSPTPSGPSIR